MTTPLILACAWLGDHAVDLWQEPDATWQAGNDDRSVIGHGPNPDAALDAYLAGLQAAREVLGVNEDEGVRPYDPARPYLQQVGEALGQGPSETLLDAARRVAAASRPAPSASLEARAMAACEAWKAARLSDDDPEIQYPHAWQAVVRAVDASRPASLTEAEADALASFAAIDWGTAGDWADHMILACDSNGAKSIFALAAAVRASRGEIPDVRPQPSEPTDDEHSNWPLCRVCERPFAEHGPDPGNGTPRGIPGECDGYEAGPSEPTAVDDFPPDGAAFRVGNMGAFREACLRAAEGEELDLSACHITPVDPRTLS